MYTGYLYQVVNHDTTVYIEIETGLTVQANRAYWLYGG